MPLWVKLLVPLRVMREEEEVSNTREVEKNAPSTKVGEQQSTVYVATLKGKFSLSTFIIQKRKFSRKDVVFSQFNQTEKSIFS